MSLHVLSPAATTSGEGIIDWRARVAAARDMSLRVLRNIGTGRPSEVLPTAVETLLRSQDEGDIESRLDV